VSRSALRLALVVVLGLWALGTTVPSVNALTHPPGTFGFRADYDGRITEVDGQGQAADAGITTNDRIHLPLTPMEYRAYAAPRAPIPAPGQRATFGIQFSTGVRTVTLTATVRPMASLERWSVILTIFAVTIYVLIAGSLVMLRPSRATWGFYLACLGINPAPPEALGVFPYPWANIVQIGDHLMLALGTAGFLVFALRFPSGEVSGWRALLDRYSWLVFLVSAVLLLSVDVRPLIFAEPAETLKNITLGWESAIGLLVVAALLGTYSQASAQDRQRIRWVIVGFVIGVTAAIISATVGYSAHVSRSMVALSNWAHLFTTAVPITVAYAVVRHRVLDIRFAFSRALVYGIITFGAIAAFALIEWFFQHVIAEQQAAVYVEIIAAIGLGVGFHSLEARLDGLVDSVIFRTRHLADERLARIAAALPHARSLGAVDELLTSAPREAWQLGSAAVFRRDDDNCYVRTAAAGWGDGTAVSFDGNDVLLLTLKEELAPIRLPDIRWQPDSVPPADQRPVLAVPVVVRRSLAGVALYAGPLSGEAFDPDAISLLERLAAGAAGAYDQLEIENLRAQVRKLEARLTER
jgi:hypothetical protein